MLLFSSVNGWSQCSFDSNDGGAITDANFTSTSTNFTGSIGSSFVACQSGVLSSLGLLSTGSTSGLTISIYEGEGTAGNLLGAVTGVAVTAAASIDDRSLIDFSGENISLIGGTTYTWSVTSGAVSTRVSDTDIYGDGIAYSVGTGFAGNDFLFSVSIDQAFTNPALCSFDSNDAGAITDANFTSTSANFTGSIGSSFIACQTGVLSSLGLFSTGNTTGLAISIYEGEGIAGNLLGTFTGASVTAAASIDDRSLIDFSGENISLTGGAAYTWSVTTGAVSTRVTNADIYADGIVYSGGTGFASNDFLFSVSIGEAVAIDVDPPVVSSISLPGVQPPASSSLTYTVTFDEAASNVSADDFELTTTGSATANVGSPVTADGGLTYTVPVESISGTGTLRLDMLASTDIVDTSLNGNGNNGFVSAFTAGDVHTADLSAGTGSCSFDSNDAGTITDANFVSTSTNFTGSIGSSFVACQTGVLSSLGLFSTGTTSGLNISIYEGEGIAGNLLGTVTGAAVTAAASVDDRSLIDFSGESINLTDGATYTWSVTSGAVSTRVSDTDIYVDGISFSGGIGFATNDFLFSVSIEEAVAVDVDPPEITVNDIIVSNDPGVCEAVVTSFGASATDDSGTADLTFDIAEGTQFAVGITTVTATATDPSGNSAQATFDITVNDTEVPAISLNGDATLNLSLGDAYAELGATVTDNCPSPSAVAVGGDAVNTSAVGSYTVTYDATDAAGNAAVQITRTVNVADNAVPVISVSDITVDNDAGICEAVVTSYGASASDDSGTATLTFDIAEGTQFAVGITTVTATATDPSGNSAQAAFDITVNDTEVPVISLNGDATLNLSLGGAYAEPGATVADNCPSPSAVAIGGDAVNTSAVGTYLVTYDATDASGNAATQVTRTVNVLDNAGPVITVSDININSEPGECGATIFDYGASATDPSGIADFNFSIPEGSFFDPGTTEVTAFTSDNEGNVSQATFTITVNDVEAPTLVAQGITVELDENGFAELPPLNPEVILFQGTFDDDSPALNTNSLVNWNVTQGNVDVYFAGQFGSPFADNALELSGSVNGAIETKETFTLEPGNYLFSFEARGFNGDAAIGIDIGNVLNTSFTDFTGVRQTVVFEFTVTQTTSATIRLNEFGGGDSFSGTLLDNLLLQKLADSILISTSDNCGVVSITPSVTGFGCNELGTQLVTLTVRDEAGNEASETVEVQVVDNLAPTFATRESFVLLLDENGEASVTPADYNLGTVQDNCGVERLEFDRTEFGCGDVGFHVINVTAFDASGNATTTQADVEVRDEIAPVFLTRESFILFLDANGQATLTPDQYNTATIQTNCDLDRVELSRTNFECGDVGFLTIEVTAFDGNGLSTITEADVEVRDEIAPVISLIGDAVVEVDQGSLYFEQGADVVDNCNAPLVIGGVVDTNVAGTYIVTYNAVDENGNPAREVTRTVNVIQVDTDGPVITANDITAFTREDRCSAVVQDYGVTATDESGVADISFSFVPGTVFPLGTTPVTATATDNFGNVSSATFNVTVIDNVPPFVLGNDITLALDENGEADLVVPDAPQIIFSEDFESDATGLDLNSLNQWNVTQGNVDVFFGGQFGLPITNNALELAGNVNGAIETKEAIQFEPGTYRLRIDYRGITGDASIGIDIGTLLGTSITAFTNEFYEPAEFDFVVTQTTSATLRLNEFGGGTQGSGTLIDNVRILRQPDSIIASVFDNCEVTSITASRTEFSCADLGPQAVTITVADAAGNESSTDITVQVVDNTAPQFLTRESFILLLDENGEASVTPADYNLGTVQDNCGVDRLEFDRTDFGCGDVGFHVINVTAFDASGNATTTQADVEVRDEIAPVFLTRESFIIFLDANGQANLTPDQYNTATIQTNCDLDRVEFDRTEFNCSDLGFITINVTAFDGNGLATTTEADVEVRDVIAPTALARDITVVLDEAGNATIRPEDINNGSTDNCGIESLSLDRTVFDCDDIGEQNTVTLTVTDGNGLTATAQAMVTVSDITAPVLEVQDITLSLDANGQASLPALDGQTQLFFDDFSADAPALAKTALNNWNVIVGDVDVFLPNQFDLPFSSNALDVAGDVNGAIESKQSFLFEPGDYRLTFTVLGNNDDAKLELEIGNLVGTTFTEFIGGTIETRSVDFTVTTTTTATIVFSEFGDEPFFSGTTLDDIELSRLGEGLVTFADDACGIASIIADRTTFDCTDLGARQVTITATDANGNIANATATVNILDDLAPSVITQNITLALEANGEVTLNSQDLDGGTTDNCDFTLSVTQTTFNCASLGENTVTLTATDGSGNSASAIAIVTVVDNAGPVLDDVTVEVALDEEGTGSLSPADVQAAVADNCGVANITIATTEFNCENLGANAVSITATDVNGNVTTGTITVNVIDIIPPVVVTEDIVLSLDENGQAVITSDDVLILSEDEIDTGEECTVSEAEHHAVWLSDYIRKRGRGGDDDDDDDNWARKRSGSDLSNHKWRRGRGKGKGRGDDDDDDDDDRHHRPENTRFVFEADGGSLSRNADGMATVTGIIRSTAHANDQWMVTLNLENARTWDEWSALGRGFKDEAGLAGDRFLDWTYYEMAEGSVLTGAGINEGEEIVLSHAPADFRFGFQLGEAANSKNDNFGLSGWFFYTNRKGKVKQGDFNLDVTDCTPNTPPADVLVTNDNCGLGDITLSQSVFNCTDVGENLVEVTVADQSGNETTAFATVTISDDQAPIAVAQDITVSLGPDGTVIISPENLDGGSSDNCEIVSFSISQDTFTCDDVSNAHQYYGFSWWWKKDQKKGTLVTLTVTDAVGNTDTAEAYVTVVDDTAPVISSEPITLVVFGNRRERLRHVDVAPRVTDNCEVSWIYFKNTRFSRRDAGMNTVKVIAKDESGNLTTGMVNVEVIDITSLGRRVDICFNGEPRRVDRGAVQHWLRKGASLGSCEPDLSMTVGAPSLSDVAGELPPKAPLIELGAYPNPTQGETLIKFSSDVAGPASVGVISPNGVRLATLFDGEIEANENQEVHYNTGQLPSGIYVVRLVTAGEVRNLKLIVKK